MGYNKEEKLHIVAVVAVIRDEKGKYLVLRRHENEIVYPGMYTFPGGKIEENDSVEETLAKEAKEEANLSLKPQKILLKDKSFTRPDGQTVKVFSYLCECKNPEDLKINEEFTNYKWVDIEELRNLEHVGIEEEILQAEKILEQNIPFETLSTRSVKEE